MPHSLTEQFAGVLVAAPLGVLDYRVDESTDIAVGDRVLVPLGTRKVVGIVVKIHANSAIDPKKLKSIKGVLGETTPLREEWLNLTRFAADYYVRSWGEAALSALPKFFREPPRARREASIARIRKMPDRELPKTMPPMLNDEQREAVKVIGQKQGFCPVVLFGITGSGKTEVYLHIIREALDKNPENQVLLLVPEINLTPQLEARVRERFPEECVVTLHSALSAGDRARNWLAVHEGRSRVLVGTRLAVFASFKALSLVIVDEEHDESYKAGDGLRFSARDMAIKRAQINAVPCILGSATPSLETWQKVRQGKFGLVRLSRRAIETASCPEIEIVDIRAERGVLLTRSVCEAIDATLNRGEQVLVFINRRGFAPTVTCPACGWVSRCVHCSGFTVFHKKENRLVCHHCASTYEIPRTCPTCGNAGLEAVGSGTQRLEEEIGKRWPTARILRIDRDSIRTKALAQKAFKQIHAGEADIIVGTQMISKGHDFKRVSLVVVLNADALLVSASMRAEENLFCLLMQVSGRAGRDQTAGHVMIQSRYVTHPLFSEVVEQDYEAFAARVLEQRREAGVPPFTCQALLLAQSTRLERSLGFLSRAVAKARGLAQEGIQIYDPVPMSLMRLMDEERAQVLVEAEGRAKLNAFLSAWIATLEKENMVSWTVEVDPIEI